MISSVNSSNYAFYAAPTRGNGSESSTCSCGQPGCDCAATQGRLTAGGNASANAATGNETAETGRKVNQAASINATTQLTDAELTMVRELKQRDQKVRQHEMAHLMASGGLAQGSPNYTYQRGPDGQNYAVGGHVNLDISPGKTPEETLQKAQTIQAAALAPADPSGQDRSVAAMASQMAMQARMEMRQQQAAEQSSLLQRNDDSPAKRLAQQFLSAVTPQPEPLLQLAA